MLILVPNDLPQARFEAVRGAAAGASVEAFHVERTRPLWARGVSSAARRYLRSPLLAPALDLAARQERCELVLDGSARSREQAEALLVTSSVPHAFVPALVESLPRLRWIHSSYAGVDRFDLARLRERGIRLTAPLGVHSRRIAEFVLALVYADAKRLHEHWESRARRQPRHLRSTELRDLALGVVGFGSIGQAVSRLAVSNGLRVQAYDRDPRRATQAEGIALAGSLEEVLASSDVVVLALPLTESTRGLVGARELAGMRSHALLVNVGRAGTIVERDLVAALRRGVIRRACLDVLDDDDDVPSQHALLRAPTVLYTGHSAAASGRSDDEVFSGFIDNVRRWTAGEPLGGEVGGRGPAGAQSPTWRVSS